MNKEMYKTLGFNPYLIHHLMNYDVNHVLGYCCCTPYYFETSHLNDGTIFPLWECGTTVTYFNKASASFEVCNLERPDDILVSCNCVQEILAYLILELMEGEITDDKIIETGEAIGFTKTTELLSTANSAEDYATWRMEYFKQWK